MLLSFCQFAAAVPGWQAGADGLPAGQAWTGHSKGTERDTPVQRSTGRKIKRKIKKRKIKKADETQQGGRRWRGKELKQKEQGRGSHSSLQFGEQPLPHLVCPERASAAPGSAIP